MGRNLTVEKVDDTSLWDSFVSTSPQGTIFSSSRWLNVASTAQGGEPVILGVWENGKLVAGVSFVHIARGLLKKAATPVLTPYSGVIYRPNPGKRDSEAESFNMSCAELLIAHLSERYHHVFLIHAPEYGDIRPFTWRGWRSTVRYTYVMDIRDTEALWSLLERRVRTVIRNAESSLVLGGPIDSGEFIRLYEHIYSDRSRPLPIGSSLVRSLVDAVMESGNAEMRTVRDSEDRVISAMITVYDTSRVYAWLSGSIPGENSTGAFSLLFWDTVRRHSGERSKLDMVGGNIDSIAFFKKGFGGKLTSYYVTEYYSSRLSRMAVTAFSGMRRFLR